MKNIGFYVVDNERFKKLHTVLPDFYYYKTVHRAKINIKQYKQYGTLNKIILPKRTVINPDVNKDKDKDEDLFSVFIPHTETQAINLNLLSSVASQYYHSEETGHVNIFYICLNIHQKSQEDRVKILNFFVDNFENYMDDQILFFLFLENAKLLMMNNSNYVINYARKLYKLGMKFYKNDILSYISDYHTVSFVTEYNDELFTFGIEHILRPILTEYNIMDHYYEIINVDTEHLTIGTPNSYTKDYKQILLTKLFNYLQSSHYDMTLNTLCDEINNIILLYKKLSFDNLQQIIVIFKNILINIPYDEMEPHDFNQINLSNILHNTRNHRISCSNKKKYDTALLKYCMNIINQYNKYVTVDNTQCLCRIISNMISFNACLFIDANHDIRNHYDPIEFHLDQSPESNESETESDSEDDQFNNSYYEEYETYR